MLVALCLGDFFFYLLFASCFTWIHHYHSQNSCFERSMRPSLVVVLSLQSTLRYSCGQHFFFRLEHVCLLAPLHTYAPPPPPLPHPHTDSPSLSLFLSFFLSLSLSLSLSLCLSLSLFLSLSVCLSLSLRICTHIHTHTHTHTHAHTHTHTQLSTTHVHRASEQHAMPGPSCPVSTGVIINALTYFMGCPDAKFPGSSRRKAPVGARFSESRRTGTNTRQAQIQVVKCIYGNSAEYVAVGNW